MDSIKDRIYNWNLRFPLDRWFRQKYKIPIFSKEHRESSFIDQLMEFQEDRIFNKLSIKKIEYSAGHGNWLIEVKATDKEIDDMYDNIKI